MAAELQPITSVMGDYFNLPQVQERYADIALMAAEIHKNRSEGSDEIQPEGITTISVAAHHDGEVVWDALRSHIESFGPEHSPRTQVILALNDPPGTSREKVANIEDAIRTFAKENKHFPLSFFYTGYEAGTPSGTYRGDLADAGLLWALYLSKFRKPELEDFAIITNSIHEKQRSRGYESTMLNKLAEGGTIAVQGLIKYERSGFTNINKMMKWLCMPVEAGVASCEFNLGMSVRDAFVPAEGYNRMARVNDPQEMPRSNSLIAKVLGESTVKIVKGAAVVLSSKNMTRAALEGILPGTTDTPGALDQAGDESNQVGVDDKAYLDWTYNYQRDILSQYSAVALQQGGKTGVLRFIAKVEATRAQLGGKALSTEEVGKVLLDLLGDGS